MRRTELHIDYEKQRVTIGNVDPENGQATQMLATFKTTDLSAVFVRLTHFSIGGGTQTSRRFRDMVLIVSGHVETVRWRDEEADDTRHSAYGAAAQLAVMIK